MQKKLPNGRQLVALKNRIVSCFTESHWRELGALTETMDMINCHHRLLRSLSWKDSDYDGHALDIINRIIESSPDNYKILCDYVSEKCPEHGEFVSCDDFAVRRIVFSPMVFKVPSAKPSLNLLSVMMPFDLQMQPVYETIKSAASTTGFDCKRADDIWDDSTIVQDVFSLIFQSYVVVCDFTGKNPNVFYEAGIAHTLGKHVIPITQNPEHIPFDLRHHRHSHYLNNSEGRDELQRALENRLSALSEKKACASWD